MGNIVIIGSDAPRAFRLSEHARAQNVTPIHAMSDDSLHVWIGEERPPDGCHIWCRTSSGGKFWENVSCADTERVLLNLNAVAIHCVPISPLLPHAHILVEGPGSVRVFSSEADLHKHLVSASQHYGEKF